MKTQFLKLENSCNEHWENMEPNDKGNYCDLCSKTVIDLTNLSQLEISEVFKKYGDKLCGKITQNQLNTPILSIDNPYEFYKPKSNITASLILATSLTIGQTTQATNRIIKSEIAQTSCLSVESKNVFSKSSVKEQKLEETTIFTGVITSEYSGKGVENAKIIFFSAQKVLSTYTLKDGVFSLEIPTHLIDEDNVIRVSFDNAKEEFINFRTYSYLNKNYILSKKELNTEYFIKAKPIGDLMGPLIRCNDDSESKARVLKNGVEINYTEFVKESSGFNRNCTIRNNSYLYFYGEFAIAIYGQKAKHGLYIYQY